ncbi:MAG TPA: hypothetical protein VL463_33895 [Kofleriaceae bacterium]|nr:hypothetical protein [Kofleriaceae bacterium]
MRFGILIALFAACRSPSDCDRALARLARIREAKHQVRPSAAGVELMREGCEKVGRKDPAIRCALDTPTDEAAAQCLDRFLRAVVHDDSPPGSGAPPVPPAGQGLNPLLDTGDP